MCKNTHKNRDAIRRAQGEERENEEIKGENCATEKIYEFDFLEIERDVYGPVFERERECLFSVDKWRIHNRRFKLLSLI